MQRLIDVNEILKSEHQHYDYMADEYYVLVRDIENAPTVDDERIVKDYCRETHQTLVSDKYWLYDPREDVRHGHWVDMGDFESCSVCNGTHLKEYQTYYGKCLWVKSDYCPHCGAKMDEVEEDGNKPKSI